MNMQEHVNFKQIFDALDIALVVFEAQKKIVYANDLFANYLNSSKEEILSQSIKQFNPFSTLLTKDFLLSLQKTGQWQGELVMHHKRQKKCLFVRIKSIYDDQKNLLWYVLSLHDVTFQKTSEKRISHLAYFDNLTNLPNFYYFKQLMKKEIDISLKNSQKFALLFLDIDKFKCINDTYGHEFGDCFLKTFVQRLKKNVRSTDIIGRRGGDEFHIILRNINTIKYVEHFSQYLLTIMQDPFLVKKKLIHMTISIGAVYFPKDGINQNMLIKKADEAMYQSKNRGRNIYTVYSK